MALKNLQSLAQFVACQNGGNVTGLEGKDGALALAPATPSLPHPMHALHVEPDTGSRPYRGYRATAATRAGRLASFACSEGVSGSRRSTRIASHGKRSQRNHSHGYIRIARLFCGNQWFTNRAVPSNSPRFSAQPESNVGMPADLKRG